MAVAANPQPNHSVCMDGQPLGRVLIFGVYTLFLHWLERLLGEVMDFLIKLVHKLSISAYPNCY